MYFRSRLGFPPLVLSAGYVLASISFTCAQRRSLPLDRLKAFERTEIILLLELHQ